MTFEPNTTNFMVTDVNHGQPLYRVQMEGGDDPYLGMISPLGDGEVGYIVFYMVGMCPTIEEAVRQLADFERAGDALTECASMFSDDWDGI